VQLRTTQIQNETVEFANVTKSKKARSVKISADFFEEIKAHCKEHKLPDKRVYEEAKSAFRHCIQRTGIELAEGQLTHVLRHTFASHFVMSGRNLLTLQKILGHQDYVTTLKYAHLAPSHLEEVVNFNPITLLEKK
jgi:site-specific recombinase XerD